ncbi:hypothetical protein UK23_17620 [Lentzea aerocolonigenes]|uniref:Uncharacterized protein n=1 Tax=Lentzea aerocolonigenes TaxID=68170 RepID=A0A0F0H3K9_LENAE|nr:hypothetical protein [Lentzea aerocolonigenes]KJK48218.1 hypothetical protein UK23_17620 [Lentzea aerocolonigenes]
MPAPVRRSELVLLVYLAVVFAVASTVVVGSVVHIERTGLVVHGLGDGTVLTAAAVPDISLTVGDRTVLDRVEVLVDDTRIATHRDGDRLTLDNFAPAEGSHLFLARVRSLAPLVLAAEVEHQFTVTRFG